MDVTKRACRASLLLSDVGSAAIEFGIAIPMFVILTVGVVEVGFTAYQAMQVQDASEAGALYAATNSGDPAGIAAAVVNATNTAAITATPPPAQFCGCAGVAGIATVACSTSCADGNPAGQYVRINATLTRKSLIPNSGLPLPATFTAQSIIRLN